MEVLIFCPVCIGDITRKFGLGAYVQMLGQALDYKGVKYEVVSNLDDVLKSDVSNVHLLDDFYLNDIKKLKDVGKKTIVHFHGWIVPNDILEYPKVADKIVFVSNIQKRLYKNLNGVVLHNGIVDPGNYMSSFRDIDFIFTSRYDSNKGWRWLYENVKKTGFKIGITGNGELDGAINFGYLDWISLMKVLGRSKIHVLPANFEAFGYASAYAITQGAVPAVSIFSGISEILDDSVSIKFNPFRVGMPELYGMYLKKNIDPNEVRNFILKFDYKWYSEQLMPVYEEVFE